MPEVDRGRCDSRNILGVIMEIDLTKVLYIIGTKDGILNSLYTRNQFTICKEGTVNISAVPLIGSQGYNRCNCKTLAEMIFLCPESQISCTALSAIIVCHAKTNDIHVGTYHDVFIYLFLFLYQLM